MFGRLFDGIGTKKLSFEWGLEMKVYSFGEDVGKEITRFGSEHFKMTRILQAQDTQSIHVGCAYLGKGGHIGQHQAMSDQLFMVVQGAGWVTGSGGTRTPIATGDAVYWAQGEWHETGSDSGLTAIVFEGECLDPQSSMTERTDSPIEPPR